MLGITIYSDCCKCSWPTSWCVCVCVWFFFSVIIICNSVYMSTINYFVELHFWEGVGGKLLFVLCWYECPLVVFTFSMQELTCMHCIYLVL